MFEHTMSPRPSLAFATAFQTLLPAKFWSRLKLHHLVEIPRLVRLLIIVFLPGHIALSAFAGWMHYKTASAAAWWMQGAWQDTLLAVLIPYWIPDPEGSMTVASPAFILMIAHIAAALILLALRDTMGIAKVRIEHPIRVTIYGCIPLVVFGQAAYGVLWLGLYESMMGTLPSDYLTILFLVLAFASISLLAWMARWWWCAIRTYMQLPRPLIVWIAVFPTACLAGFTLWFASVVWIQ